MAARAAGPAPFFPGIRWHSWVTAGEEAVPPGGPLALSHWSASEPRPRPAARSLVPLAPLKAIGRLRSPSDWPTEQPPSSTPTADTTEFRALGRREGLLFRGDWGWGPRWGEAINTEECRGLSASKTWIRVLGVLEPVSGSEDRSINTQIAEAGEAGCGSESRAREPPRKWGCQKQKFPESRVSCTEDLWTADRRGSGYVECEKRMSEPWALLPSLDRGLPIHVWASARPEKGSGPRFPPAAAAFPATGLPRARCSGRGPALPSPTARERARITGLKLGRRR